MFDTNPSDHIEYLEHLDEQVNKIREEHERVLAKYDGGCRKLTKEDYECVTSMVHAENRLDWYSRLGTDVYRNEYCKIWNTSTREDYNPHVYYHRMSMLSTIIVSKVAKHMADGKGIGKALFKASVAVMKLASVYRGAEEWMKVKKGGMIVGLTFAAFNMKYGSDVLLDVGMDLYIPPKIAQEDGESIAMFMKRYGIAAKERQMKQKEAWCRYLITL